MGFGLVAITACVAYLAYWNATSEEKTFTSPDIGISRKKISKWD